MSFFDFFSKKLPAITYGVTVCNERDELKRLLDHLLMYVKSNDQIIVLQDVTQVDESVTRLIETYGDSVLHLKASLSGDFSSFKNQLINQAKGEYLFQLDADEIPTKFLLTDIGLFLRKYRRYDCFCIPRVNIVNGIDEGKLKRWGWTQNDAGYINFPDYQMRLFKLGRRSIYWKNKVHEVLVGYRKVRCFPVDNYDYCLIHEKGIDKQVQQNDFYDKNF